MRKLKISTQTTPTQVDHPLNPFTWAKLAAESDSLDTARLAIADRLAQVLEVADLTLFGPTPERILHRKRRWFLPSKTHHSGYVLCEEWNDFLRREENAGKEPLPRYCVPNRAPIFFWENCPLFQRMTEEERQFTKNHLNFGLKHGMLAVNIDAAAGTTNVLGVGVHGTLSDFNNFERSSTLDLQLAYAWFCESWALKEIYRGGISGHLSPRERECLLWSTQGTNAVDTADRLNLAQSTVNEYLNSAMAKLGASSRTQACARATLLGFIEP